MVVDIIVSVALYKPLGIAGLVIGTAVANVVMTALQWRRLRIGFNGRLEGRQTPDDHRADPGRLGADGRRSRRRLGGARRSLLGRSLPAQIDLGRRRRSRLGLAFYAKLVLAMRDARGAPDPGARARPPARRSAVS